MPHPPRVSKNELGCVDFGILTIREDEEQAVLERFAPHAIVATDGDDPASWPYAISIVHVDRGWYSVAIVRCLHQGNNQAARVAQDLIRDLRPKWLITAGIAGGFPDREFTLGDVVLSSFVYDLSVTAIKPNQSETYSVMGGFMPRPVEQFLAGLGAQRNFLGEWNAAKSLRSKRPGVDMTQLKLSGDDAYQSELSEALAVNFGSRRRRRPIFKVGPIISSSRLVRDPELVQEWSQFARHALAVEMEFAGVYTAARGKGAAGGDLPVLTVRGVSDIVGLTRDAEWTTYACNTAAAFTAALIKCGSVLPPNSGSVSVKVSDAASANAAAEYLALRVGPIPKIDPDDCVRRLFVGREGMLEDLSTAIDSMVRERVDTSWGAVRFVWVHGLGGMGKSWLLRALYLRATDLYETGGRLKVALVDWHAPLWRDPLDTPPRQPRDVFDAIATRLAQLYGIAAISEYRQACAIVEAAAPDHAKWRDAFQHACDHVVSVCGSALAEEILRADQNSHVAFAETAPSLQLTLLHVLREWNHWPAEPRDRAQAIGTLLKHRPERARLAQEVAHRAGVTAKEVVMPESVLVETLRDAIRRACAATPLLLILDTCEYLQGSLDDALRHLVAPLIHEGVDIFTVIASRSQPDPDRQPEHQGWLNSITERRRRLIRFDEQARFTTSELECILVRSARPLSSDLHETAIALHSATLGLPVAVEPLIRTHETEGELTIDELLGISLPEDCTRSADEDEIRRLVIETVAKRFLLHVERSSNHTDMRDIVTLAVLRQVDRRILKQLWAPCDVDDRLRTLDRKYSLLQGGDLHSDVRRFLRHRWREIPPALMPAVLQELEAALTSAQFHSAPGSLEDMDHRFDWVNLLAWREKETVLLRCAATLAVGVVYNADCEPLASLLGEIEGSGPRDESARRLMLSVCQHGVIGASWILSSDHFIELLGECDPSQLDEQERVCICILAGLHAHSNKDYLLAIERFEEAFRLLGSVEVMPRNKQVIRAYLDAVFWHTIDRSDPDIVTKAKGWAEQIDIRDASIWLGLGNLAHNLEEWDKSIVAYQTAIDLDPDTPMYRGYLAHVYEHHLLDLEAAERTYREAIANWEWLPWAWQGLARVLQHRPGRRQEACETLERAVKLFDDAAMMISLASLLRNVPGRERDAVELADRVLDSIDDIDDAHVLAEILDVVGDLLPATRIAVLIPRLPELADKAGRWDETALFADRFGSPEDCDRIYRAWIQSESEEVRCRISWAWSLLARGGNVLGRSLAAEAVERDPNSRVARLVLAAACMKERSNSETVRIVEDLLCDADESRASWIAFASHNLCHQHPESIHELLRLQDPLAYTGFYLEGEVPEHLGEMRASLSFNGERIVGDGQDQVGEFSLEGLINWGRATCVIEKHYLLKHTVRYHGVLVYGAIVGRYDISSRVNGAFLLWPLGL